MQLSGSHPHQDSESIVRDTKCALSVCGTSSLGHFDYDAKETTLWQTLYWTVCGLSKTQI